MRIGKNTEKFYGIFYVNICGNICDDLITAKKNTIIFAVEKNTEIFYGIFMQIFLKIFVVLKIPQKNTLIFAVENFFAFLTQIFAEIFSLV